MPRFGCTLFQRTYNTISKGEKPSVAFEIINTGNSSTNPCWVSVVGNGNFFIEHKRVKLKALQPNESTTLEVPLEFNAAATDKDLPSQFILCITSLDGAEMWRQSFPLSMGQYMGDFENAIPKREILVKDKNDRLMKVPAPVNIMIIGPAGQGKSSFAQNIFTILQKYPMCESVVRSLTVGNYSRETSQEQQRAGHMTVEFNLYGSESMNERYNNLGIWDTPGISLNTYQGDEMRNLLNGLISKQGFTLDDNMDDQSIRDRMRENKNTRGFRVPQAVILFLTTAVSDDPELMTKMRDQVRELRDFGYQPLVVVSKADEGEQEETSKKIRENPLELFKHAPHKEKDIYDLGNELGVGQNNVYYMVSYSTEQERVFGIDKLTYMVLHEALKRAEEFIEMEEKTQNTKYKCADYSSGKIMTRQQRRKIMNEDYSYLYELGEVLDENCPSVGNATSCSTAYPTLSTTSSGNTNPQTPCKDCSGCYQNPVSYICDPCRHFNICENCFKEKKLKVGDRCPECRKSIDFLIKA